MAGGQPEGIPLPVELGITAVLLELANAEEVLAHCGHDENSHEGERDWLPFGVPGYRI